MKKFISFFTFLFIAICVNLFPLKTMADNSTYKQLTDVPTIYINTEKGQSITSEDTYIYATMIYVDGSSVTQYDSLQIRGRGNSTWTSMPKKSYRIKFNSKEKFLGKSYANAKSWTLLANCTDKSMIRDAITRDLGEFISMKNTPAAKFVDLYLNGTYLGTYQISDQVEVRPHRVNITEQDEVLTDTSNITGGYLLEVDGFADTSEKYFYTSSKNIYVRIHYPDEDYLQPKQTTYISNYVNNFEKTLFSTNFDDADNGYRQYVDSMSLINWYIATEMTANVDGFWSTYFYKDKDDPHLYFGPLWDYDIAYNNCSRTGDVTKALMMDQGFGTNLTKVWVTQMWKDKWFANKVNSRWKEIVATGLNTYLNNKTDSLATVLAKTEVENYKTWSISYRYYNELVLHSSYQDYITDLHTFINNHIPYLTTQFASRATNGNTETTTEFNPLSNYYYRIYNKGVSIATIDVTDAATAAGSTICLYASTLDRSTQQWQFVKSGKYYQIINRASGMALNDPSLSSQSTTGVQLTITNANINDTRQLWTAVAQGTDGYYNFKNVSTGKIINNNAHGTANGNMIISYASNSSDATSDARLWISEPDDEIIPAGINSTQNEIDYALTYNKDLQFIHFISPSVSDLTFTASVFNSKGVNVGTFKASEEFSTSSLNHDMYIVRWNIDGKTHTAKFMK
jgi:hypothetical protein